MKNIKNFKNFGKSIYENQGDLFSGGVRSGHFTTGMDFLNQFIEGGYTTKKQFSSAELSKLDDYVSSNEEAASGSNNPEIYEEMIKQGVLDFLMSNNYMSPENYETLGGKNLDFYTRKRPQYTLRPGEGME